MGDDDDDVLEELTDALPPLAEADEEELGVDEGEDFAMSEIGEGPEEIGLDVETLDAPGEELDLGEDDEEAGYAFDDAQLDLEGELDDSLDEDGWTDESEGSGSAWEDDTLDDDDDDTSNDDGGLEGVEDPSLDDFIDESETTLSIEGDDINPDEDLERVELDIG